MEDLEPSYFTQERITEKTKDESGSQRWYPVAEHEWKRIRLYSRDEFEFFLCLTPEQKEILESSLPLMVSGTAGSGKTTLSLYYLLKRHLQGKKKAPNFQFNRKEIYPVIDWYQNRLESDGLWDELDLTREVLKIYSEKNLEVPAYDVLACDEVQDFTDIQISLLLAMVNNPRDVFFAGDTKQTINPSGFRWEEVKRNFHERGLEVPELKYLALNFRSSGRIVELSNILLGLKEKYLGIKAEEIREERRYKGRPVTVVSGISEKDMLEILKIAGARRTVLVRTEEEKRRLQRRLETELVFTIGDAKGLEFDTVVLWKFCDDQLMEDVWKVILDMSKRSIHEAKIRHEINLLYVGITRSQKDLIIYDGGNPSLIWENPQFKSHVYATDDRSFIGGIWNVLTTPEEWIEQGHYFFEREFYRAAMECNNNGGDEKLFARASAYDSEKAGKYFDAALDFEKIGERERAAGNYERAGAYKKALPLWAKLENRERMFHCRSEVLLKASAGGVIQLQLDPHSEFQEKQHLRLYGYLFYEKFRSRRDAPLGKFSGQTRFQRGCLGKDSVLSGDRRGLQFSYGISG